MDNLATALAVGFIGPLVVFNCSVAYWYGKTLILEDYNKRTRLLDEEHAKRVGASIMKELSGEDVRPVPQGAFGFGNLN